MYGEGNNGDGVNAVDRSGSRELVVVGDDYGKVRLFRWPCSEVGSESREFKGHSSRVRNVRFGSGDKTVWSSGGGDHCVMQWRCFNPFEKEDGSRVGSSGSGMSILAYSLSPSIIGILFHGGEKSIMIGFALGSTTPSFSSGGTTTL